MRAEAASLSDDGYSHVATAINMLSGMLREKIETFLEKPAQTRKEEFPRFRAEILKTMETSVNQVLKNYSPWQTKLANFLTALSLLGLIYLSATAKTRGSFWLENEHAEKLRGIKQALSQESQEDKQDDAPKPGRS
jgi:hypothetical protein